MLLDFMRLVKPILALMALAGTCAAVCAQSVALSFDDGLDPRRAAQAREWNQSILRALNAAGIRSILFAAGERVDSPAGLELVRAWGLAGHSIGNHTYSHPDFNSPRESLAMFIADAEKNQALLRELPGWTARLRFPYLNEGDTARKRDGMRLWMTRHHYQSGAVSIDASDWYYDARYQAWRATHPNTDPEPFRQAYLDHLWNRAQYYRGLSRQLLGREAAHVLLLHTNGINAQFLPDIIAMFRSNGWTIISPRQAYQDPLYRATPKVLPAGESILWSVAKQAQLPNLRYPAEDDVYEKPILDRLGL
jgi:peptidoglycan-N-acetylglucosamine deacetylase